MILLLGHTGYVGSAFARELANRALPFTAISREEGDLSCGNTLKHLLDRVRPDLVINAAGWPGTPNVDETERQRERCVRSNLLLPVRLFEECQTRGITLGHISTGCIFRGAREDGSGFTEEDRPNFGFSDPSSGLYSGCKALAEAELSKGEGVYLWRLRMPFDEWDHPRNLISKFLKYERLLEARNSLSHLGDFVNVCLNSALENIPCGIYNLTNSGSITTREIVEILQRVGLAAGRKFQFFEDENEFLQKAANVRRATCVLQSSKIGQAGLPLRSVQEALEDAVRKWRVG